MFGGKAAQPSRQSSAVHSRPVVTALALVGSWERTSLVPASSTGACGPARSAARPTGAAKRMPGVPGWMLVQRQTARAASGGTLIP